MSQSPQIGAEWQGYGYNLVTALDNFFGHTVTPEDLLRTGTERLPHTFWDQLWEALEPLAEATTGPTAGLQDVFSIHNYWWRHAYIANKQHCDNCVSSIKSFLLYYPSVLLCYRPTLVNFVVNADDITGRDRMITSPALALPHFVRSFAPIVALRALVEKGIIMIVPALDRQFNKPLLKSAKSVLPKMYTRVKVSGLLDRARILHLLEDVYQKEPRYVQTKKGWRSESIRSDTLLRVLLDEFEQEVSSCELLGPNYVADQSELWELLQIRFSLFTESSRHLNKIEQFLATLVTDVSLPGLKELTSKDIVNIRLNDDQFEEWRLGLRSVLRHFENRPITQDSFEREFREVAAEMLLPRAQQLERISKTTGLSRVTSTASMRFLLSSMAAYFGGTLIGAAELAFLPTAIGAGILGLWEIAKAAHAIGSKALLKHYSLLTPADHL